jgi:hypothetical protein
MGPHDLAAGAESDANDWKELAERLLHHPYPGGPSRAAEVLLHRLPDDFPANVPVPHDWRLLGSKIYGQGGRPWTIEAVLDAQGAESELLSGYESQVTAGGWSTFETPEPMHGGFTSGVTAISRVFRVEGAGPLLRITVAARNNMPADIRLSVDWETPRRTANRPHGIPPGAERMPSLRSPEGVPLAADSSGGGGEYRWYSYATAETDMPPSALAGHLAGQLEEMGWTRIAGTADDVATWSSWRLPGEGDWHGLLLVLEAFARGQRSLFLQVEGGPPGDQ